LNKTEPIEPKPPIKRKHFWLRRALRVLSGILVFLFLIIIFIRSPWGQNIIVDKVVNYVSEKTHTIVKIEKLFITFDGDVQLNGLYLEDKKGDTLVYSKSLEANVPLWKMIRGEAIGVDALDWDGLRVNIIRKDSISGYNFQFLIDAFASSDTTTVKNDTTSTPLDLVIGNLNFKNFDVVFNDAVAGIDSRFKIGTLKAHMETTNVEHMVFDASEIELSYANIKFIQKPVVIDTTASDVTLPKLSFKNLALNNVVAYYESQPNRLIADVDISEFSTEIPIINLADNDFNLKKITLKNSKIKLTTDAKNTGLTQKTKEKEGTAKSDMNTFKWPQIKINISAIDFENNQIDFRVGNAKAKKEVFNANAISLSKLTLKAKDITLKDKQGTLNLEQLNFNEISGLNLKQLATNFKVTDQQMRLNGLKFKLNNNTISGYARLDYRSLSKLIAAPETIKVDLNFPSFNLSLSEIFKFQPELKNNQYLDTLSKKELKGNLKASGNLASIDLTKAEINWGNTTHISVNGTLQNIINPEILQFDITQFLAETKRSDIIQFVNETDLGVSLPEDIKLIGELTGNSQDITGNAKLISTQGIANIDGNFKNTDTIVYDAYVTIEDYKLNELLNNPQLGALSLSLNSKGSGKTINTLDATLDAIVSKFQLNNYAIKNLKINGKITDGTGHILSTYKDENLNTNLDALVVLDSMASEANIQLNIIGANLQMLGLMDRNVKTAMTINANFKGNSEHFDAGATIDNGVFVYDKRTYLLGALKALAYVDKDTTSVSVSNKILDLNLKSNTNPQTFIKAIRKHVLSYFHRDEVEIESTTNYVNLKLEGTISESPLLNNVFFVNIKDLDTINISIDFNEKARKLKANITAPHINYSGNTLDSLAFTMDTDEDSFKFDLGFKNIKAGPLDVPKTVITGHQTNQELALNFSGYHNGAQLTNVNTNITGSRENLRFSVNPDVLILNTKKWVIPATNQVILTDGNLEFNDFKISKNDQSIEITDELEGITKKHAALDFKNFKISEVFYYLNPKSKVATGQLNGDFILEEPFGQTGIVASLNIKQLEVLNTDFGTLTVDAKSLGSNRYDFNAALNDGDVDLDLIGDYISSESSAKLNLNLDINTFKMKALNTLSMGEIKGGNGNFNGHFKVTGTTEDPQYSGALNFNDAEFNIAKLNTLFTLKNETLNINNDELSMRNFVIRDFDNNELVLSGTIGTKNLTNPTFNLDLKAEKFQLLNATAEDNELFYGKASFDADAQLTGDLQIPKLDAKISVGPDTDITYILPSSVASIEERDGIVTFVNRKNPDAIVTQTEAQTATITGFDITTLIKISKEAAVTIIINEQTGDNFKVSGEGDLNFTMLPNGRINLTGVYEILAGSYELNLYNLVDRKFLIAEGSRVSWSGDPFDAKLDVRAIYNVKTAASSLMAPQISGLDPSVQNKYRQVLPFNVYLNIAGELTQPEISFQLDMPEEDQGALGGEVYGRIQDVNSQEDELNRQVFSLLVLNSFYPEPGSDGSSGGFATIARDNLNDAVAGQLNAFSDKVLGDIGIELDFGIDSFTDYQGVTATERTQLDIAAQKKLFNERLTVSVGSEVDIQGVSPTGEATPLIGNVSLEYALTQDGRYSLKGFHKSEFENIVDGQTIVSGIALIFTKEFNHFDELWKAIKNNAAKKKAERKIKEEEEEEEEVIKEQQKN
jgi:translocation and assembly module TamB